MTKQVLDSEFSDYFPEEGRADRPTKEDLAKALKWADECQAAIDDFRDMSGDSLVVILGREVRALQAELEHDNYVATEVIRNWEKEIAAQREELISNKKMILNCEAAIREKDKQLKELREALQMIIDNDKTKYDYRYAGSKMAKNRNGYWPPEGQRWSTPKEIAERTIAAIDQQEIKP
jgi:DNA repair exonuclease SbcCD ATPase subunit